MFLRGMVLGIVLSAGLVGPVAASSAPSSQPRSGAPDVTHYDLRIRTDFLTRLLNVSATVHLDNPGLDSVFWFSVGSGYSVRVEERGRALPVIREGSRLCISVPNPRRTHVLDFMIDGAGLRSQGEDRDVIGAHDLFLLWSDQFYPVAFEDWATVRTTIRLPSRFQAIAPGRLVHTDRDHGDVTYVFETTHPTRLFSVFADDRWVRSERLVGGIRIQTLLHPGLERFRDRIIQSSGDVLAYYRQLFGTYDFDGFSFVTLDSMYARRAFAGFIGYSPAYLEKEMARTGHDAHETALLWWGYTLGGTGPGAFQWTEGFGDYAEVLYDEARRLPLSHNMSRTRDDYLSSIEGDVPYTELRGNTPQKYVHGKLPWLLHVIRFVDGDEAFRRGMRLVFERFRYRTFSMDELIATLEQGVGASLSWWRMEWLERKGVPDLRVEAAVDSSGGHYRLQCRFTQAGNVYHIPIEVGIHTTRGHRMERVTLSDSLQVWSLDLVERPTRIALDPHRWLLARMPRDPIPLGP